MLRRPSPRGWLRRTGAGGPAATAALAVVRRTSLPLGFALVYHRVGDPAGDRATELVPRLGTCAFSAQMAWIADRFQIVTATELPGRVRERRPGERLPLAVTFDDDVPEHLRFAAPILARHGLRATFFLCGHALDAPRALWWERLQAARDRGVLEPALAPTALRPLAVAAAREPSSIHALGAAVQHLAPADRRDVADRLLAFLGTDPPDAGMRAGDVDRLAAQGHEIGFHTRPHDGLTTLDDDALRAALTDGVPELAQAAGASPATIAYPNGMADRRVADAARAAGWAAGWTTAGRAIHGDDDPLMLPRLEPTGDRVGDVAAPIAAAVARAALGALRRRRPC